MSKVKVTQKQFKKLAQNLNLPAGDSKKVDKVLIDLLHRMYWRNWSAITGKTMTFDDIHAAKNVQAVNNFVKEFLPEIRRQAMKLIATPLLAEQEQKGEAKTWTQRF